MLHVICLVLLNRLKMTRIQPMQGFAKVWGYIAVLLPTLIGVALILAPDTAISPQTPVSELAVTLGFRNISLSLVLLYTLIRRNYKVAGYLLIVRGLTEVSDAAGYIYLNQTISVSIIVAFVLAGLSFLASFFFFRSASMLRNNADPKT